MEGQREGGREGWMDVWMEGWMDGWREGGMEGCEGPTSVDKPGLHRECCRSHIHLRPLPILCKPCPLEGPQRPLAQPTDLSPPGVPCAPQPVCTWDPFPPIWPAAAPSFSVFSHQRFSLSLGAAIGWVQSWASPLSWEGPLLSLSSLFPVLELLRGSWAFSPLIVPWD